MFVSSLPSEAERLLQHVVEAMCSASRMSSLLAKW